MKIEGTGIPPLSGGREPVRPGRGGKPLQGRGVPEDADGVDLSALSRALAELAAMDDVREDLVAGVIARLEAGEYLNEEKLRAAVLKMLGEG